jgi:hypothetical protein
VIRLDVYGESETMAAVARLLDANDEVRPGRLADAYGAEHAVVLAAV